MKKNETLHYGISSWYSTLADYTFPTTFVKLKEDELDLLANAVTEESEVYNVLNRISKAQGAFSGNTFVSGDTVAPTDTERFSFKKGAVYSAESAWRNLTESSKIRTAAKNREFECICIRPYRNMTHYREFRLFIFDGKLSLMSQYWQTRHYHRLDVKKDFYWAKAEELVDEISWLLPSETIVLDIYITSKDQMILVDFNTWGAPTSPLLAESWDIDWTKEHGIKIISPSEE